MKMNEQEAIREFKENKPDIGQLRKLYPNIADLLVGDFVNTNVYPFQQGTVVSWNLVQSEQRNSQYAKDPTYGRVPQGKFDFGRTTYTEVVTILKGVAEAEVSGNKNKFHPLEKNSCSCGKHIKISCGK